MSNRVLPAEVCARIVRYAGEGDLPALCRTSKLFQEHAEPKLYQDIFLRDPRSTPRISNSLLIHEGKRASYVRRLWVCLETRLYPRGPLPEPFWKLIGDIFSKVDNLEFLFVTDPEACRSWLTDPTSVHFQLREASLQLLWDKQLVAFLHTQKRLRILVVSDIIDSQSDNNNIQQAHPIFPGSLPELVTFDGPLEVAIELLSCPLRHVHTQIEEQDGDVLLTYLSKVVHTSKTLRSFDAVIVPESLVCSTLSILANSPLAAHMRHIGVLALPLNEVQRCDVHRSLLKFSQLDMLQLDLTHWQPPVPLPYVQRMVVTEIRIYCPSIRFILIWLGHHQFIWRSENEQWTNVHAGERRIAQDTTWRNF